MAVVNLIGGRFCRMEETARQTAGRLHCPLADDRDLVKKAAEMGPLSENRLHGALYGEPGAFGSGFKLRPKALPQLNQAMAALLAGGPLVFRGLGGFLIPPGATHVLSISLTAGEDYRVARAQSQAGLSPRKALEAIKASDLSLRRWRGFLLEPEPWTPLEFDIMLPMHDKDMAEILQLIEDSARSEPLKPTTASLGAVEDLALTGRVQAALAQRGFLHPQFKAYVSRGEVNLEINKKILRLAKLEKTLKSTALEVTGVKAVDTKMGPGYHQSDVYRKSSFELPSKVLLIDDEREFVETLSERLQLRDIGASVVYDGDQAMDALAQDQPQVVVLDLRMPGVDGIEVLKRIREQYPLVKVIVLTGHGSARDREECLGLGAFAFLQKPVDLEELSEVMRQAVGSQAVS